MKSALLTHSRSGLFPHYLLFVLAVQPVVAWQDAFFQGATVAATVADRGQRPAGSYRMEDLETINEVNGGIGFSIPLAQLPKGRGGMGFQLNLVYTSALYDTQIDLSTTSNTGTDPDSPVPTAKMIPSANGGWRYAFDYGLELEYRTYQGICDDAMLKSHKLRLRMPDGSAKLLRLGGYRDVNGGRYGGEPRFQDISGDGFYQYHPNGSANFCSGAARLVGKMVYYTDDGSYIRVETNTDGPPLPLSSVSWTVFLPDGSRVIGIGGGTTRFLDRNDNSIQIQKLTTLQGVPFTRFIDQAGRIIELYQETGTLVDRVRYTGFDGTPMSVTISKGYVNVGPRTYQCNAFYGECTDSFNLRTITQVVRQNESTGQPLETFTFGYSNCPSCGGEVNAVNLPSGARMEYSYAFDGSSSWPRLVYLNPIVQRRAIYSELADGRAVPVTDTTNYCFEGRGPTCLSSALGQSSIVGPDGGRTTNYFSGPLAGSTIYKVERPDGSVIERQWSFNRPFFAPTNVAINPYVRLEVTTLPNGSGSPTRAKARRMTLDRNGNQVRIEEFGWANYSPIVGSMTPLTALPSALSGSLVRSTATSFYHSAGLAVDGSVEDSPNAYSYPSAPRAQHSPANRQVTEASGAVRAYVAYEYDGGAAPPVRGNLTQERQWDSSKGGNLTANVITRTWSYDQWGNVVTESDARGGVTRTAYDNTGHFWISRTIADGHALQRTTTRTFDVHTDLTTSTRDIQNWITNIMSYDARGRILLVREAVGPNERRVRTAYDDALRRITEFADLSTAGDEQRVTVRHYDPLYRLRLERWIENRVTENPDAETTGIKRQYRYRFDSSAGSYRLVSKPYRANASDLAGTETTMGWSREFFDRAGRLRRTDFYAGAALPAPWGSWPNSSTGAIRTDYDGERSTVWDEADKVRSFRSDAIGRLDQVIEDNQFTTSYSYDALDNLIRIQQGVQVRTFEYTSLSRLRSSTQPEFAGAIQYTYDDNGNLTRREDPRGVITNWEPYDALQRPTRKTYSDGTPAVTYLYDQGANAFGRLTSIVTADSVTTYRNYDSLGRIGGSSQVTNGASYDFAYTYDLADNVRSLRLPTGRILSYAVDAAGRTASVSGLLAGQPRTYASQITYAPNGVSRQWQLGNGLWTGLGFNSRQQVAGVSVGSAPGSGSLLSLGLTWSNNGNLTGQTMTVPGATRTQSFGYDNLNRLQFAQEASGGVVWRQEFQFDQYGNRWQSQTIGLPLDALTPLTQNFFVASTNRLRGGSYDAAGNQLVVNPYALTYDAENRPRTVRMTVGSATFDRALYQYDGEGRRVRRLDTFMSGPAIETVFVYDAFGRLAVEYGGTASQAGTRYLSTDHLGSTRLVTSETGAVIGRRDLTPFGEVIPAGTGGRGGEFGAPTGTSILFTGKERDAETGLDYFGARYLSAAQGRFTSPDPLLSSAHIAAPQSWNRYTYTLNNPLRFTDPFGLYVCNGTNTECKEFDSALKQVERARNSYKKGSAEYNALNGSLQAYGKKGVDNGVTVQFGATKSGGAGDTNIGIAVAAGTGNKVVTADNPSGQNTVVTFDLAKNGSTGLLAVSAAHEGVHVGDGTALVGALPMDLTSGAAAGVLGGPLNLTKYATEFAAYGASSFTGQGLGFGSLKVGGNFEIWNSGWKAVDVNTLRSNGINGVLSDPNGLYKVTPGAPGKKLIE